MSNSNVVRTAIASLTQSEMYLGKETKTLPNSTLNQKLGINADVDLASTDYPQVKYVAIGNGGHSFIVGANNKVKWTAKKHTPKHNALFNQLPFVLRLPDDDLSATERLKYRLRRLEKYNGVTYIAYYLRVLDLSNTTPQLELRHVENGVTTSTPYTPTLEDLNPVAAVTTSDSAVTTTGDYIAASAKVVFQLTEDEVAEFVKAVAIIEGDDGYAIISEMATVSGVDKSVLGEFNGTQQSYTDVIGARITSHIATAWVLEYQTDGIALTIDVGNVEPLYQTS